MCSSGGGGGDTTTAAPLGSAGVAQPVSAPAPQQAAPSPAADALSAPASASGANKLAINAVGTKKYRTASVSSTGSDPGQTSTGLAIST